MLGKTMGVVCAMVAGSVMTAHASPIVVDWSMDADANPFLNGQRLTDDKGSVYTFGDLFEMRTSGSNLGAVIFDTSKPGPNVGGPDPDLLVNRGNLVTLQDTRSKRMSGGRFFQTPNDSAALDGVYEIDFLARAEALSIDLVDIDHGNLVEVILRDGAGLTRTYTVPAEWTGAPDRGFVGVATLDLTTLADQFGPGKGGPAKAWQQEGFNAADLDSMRINFANSGGWTNLTFVPTPGTTALLAMGGLAAARRRRA